MVSAKKLRAASRTVNTVNSPIDVHELIHRHSPGCALERQFYTDPRIFESDMDRMLLRHWFCAAHVASVPRPITRPVRSRPVHVRDAMSGVASAMPSNDERRRNDHSGCHR